MNGTSSSSTVASSALNGSLSGERGWSLPLFITSENKGKMGCLLGFLAAALYLGSNHLHIFTPVYLPMWPIDRAIPFVPHTVWIYTSEYWLFLSVYLLAKDMVNVNKYIYSFMGLQFVSCVIFWLWPTTYPREMFPLPADLDWATHAIFTTLRTADSAANCCPSLHVSSVYLSAFVFLSEQKRKFPFYFAWATAIAVTTLTTKQHYLVDVIAGIIMAVLFYWIFHRMVSYRPLSPKKA